MTNGVISKIGLRLESDQQIKHIEIILIFETYFTTSFKQQHITDIHKKDVSTLHKEKLMLLAYK